MARFDPNTSRMTLFSALLQASARYGANRAVLEDVERNPLTYRRLIQASLVLGAKFAEFSRRGENVGVLLPNVLAQPITLFALNAYGRVAALLNFTAGAPNLRSSARTAVLRTIITSRKFIGTAKLEGIIEALDGYKIAPGRQIRIVYLEDVRASITAADKVKGGIRALVPAAVHRRHALSPDQPAVILFTSGTEGDPKGVALSNRNLVANARQIYAFTDSFLSTADNFFNPLPNFHSFGLTAGTLLPLFFGMKSVLYPSPLHYRQVARLIGETKATILIATDTFLQGYARAAQPEDLASIRFSVAGAERVKDATRTMWARYGAVLLEGYGVTECSPVVAVNLPASNRPGTVGRFLPGIEYKLAEVPGLSDAGRLSIKGPNVMLGYMLPGAPGTISPPPDGWHDTGDIVAIDEEGFVTIRGRAKRFAKLGGEMVSLAAVESVISRLWPDGNHVVVCIPDPYKGEQLVLVTDKPDADRDAILRHMQEEKLPPLWLPKSILVVPSIPVLGSGKVDLARTIELVRQQLPLL
ncbi:MAG: 2-acylglycerophosphoethanolamine acyltransferase [Proteobacteria bacterium]|jgi:acyl-[acyl-carrier-protein]-phospholipid O-acyltransferase/long-chain-fatty-acid--[acyl-carrier-protein] ligase|nr:MAG: 2-acylglycerophosphoethanolamine acyltransferase [Pseudomonadota bacterium]